MERTLALIEQAHQGDKAARERLVEENLGLDRLTPALEQVARARLDNRNATLEELGALMEPPLGKSAINHRLRRIEELADRLKAEQGGKSNDIQDI